MMEKAATTIHFMPLVPEPVLAVLALAALLLAITAAFRLRRGLAPRLVAVTALMLGLLNPSILTQEREPVNDIAAIVVDESLSQQFGERTQRTQKALAYLKERLEGQEGLELRIVHAPSQHSPGDGTKLFTALDEAMADVPDSRRAGVVMITDGQVHDAPGPAEPTDLYGPVHALLTGDRNEKDRRILITQAPAYGIVGKTVTVKYIIQDTNTGKDTASVVMRPGAGEPDLRLVPTGIEQTIELAVTHPSQNVFELETGVLPDEITAANNSATIIVNGIRDRLKVLLVSGLPYIGERTWRNILTSDPGVDLIHFTILREPEKLDSTPQDELSLIPFPFQELFETKLDEFDLIIFDRYRLNRILPLYYFSNIVRYVKEGGALLVTSGPEYTSPESIHKTALEAILPAAPTNEIIEEPYVPELTDLGKRHPVTAGLSANGSWGPWLRLLPVTVGDGDILMQGIDEQPLLILNRVEQGRIAQLATDQIWLWSRDYEGGGPYAELIRRLAHWLMKEPELDENALEVQADGFRITLRRRQVEENATPVIMERPDGNLEPVEMPEAENGWSSVSFDVSEPGVYAFENGDMRRVVVAGGTNPKEFSGVITTEEKLAPILKASGGGAVWLADTLSPSIRVLSSGVNYSGRNWIGLRRNNDYVVKGVSDRTLLPTWISALLILGIVTFAWWREGRNG